VAKLVEELRSGRAGRRALLQAGGAAGALLAAGVPTYVLAAPSKADDNAAAAAGTNPFAGHDVTGHVTSRTAQSAQVDAASRVAGFRGKVNVTGFYTDGQQIFALGMAHGVLHDQAGATVHNVRAAVYAPVTLPQGSAAATAAAPAAPVGCQVLHLILGPLTLNLLGLVVTIPNAITIDVTAVPGAGLLGDLLCAIANLLNGTPITLAQLLQILFGLNNVLAQFA